MRARIVRTKGQTSSPARGFNFQVKMYNRRTRSTSCVTRDFGLRINECPIAPIGPRRTDCACYRPMSRQRESRSTRTIMVPTQTAQPDRPSADHAADSSNLKALVALAPQRRRVIETDNVIL